MNGNDLVKSHEPYLLKLIAATSLWCRPEVVKALQQESGNSNARWFLNARRSKKNESIRTFDNENYLDDNSKANIAFKTALGSIVKIEKFHTCHIYDDAGETYDPNFYCSIPNLVLIPSSIHSVTDHLAECRNLLRYRAYSLYGFYKDNIPAKPAYYDTLAWHPFIGNVDRALKSVVRRNSTIPNPAI